MERPFEGRRIVLGVSGGVAAYKSVELCRELVRTGAFVSPVLTRGAERFIGAATLSAVASEPARTSLWESPEPSPHTELGQRADLVVVAPATANVLAAARAGTSLDLLTTTLLATRAPVLMCPAMHTEMWEHPATRDNVAALRSRGVTVLDPAVGELAGGDVGAGRLPEVGTILASVREILGEPRRAGDLAGLHVLVSAGGTREAIDPVRFIGNRSSGRQGHAIALAARARGARVTVVTTAPTDPLLAARDDLDVHAVESAQQLHDRMLELAPTAQVVVMCAAVADFRPIAVATSKLKGRDGVPVIELEPTPKVLGALVDGRVDGQVIVGFAAETDDLVANAREKLERSGADLLVANEVGRDDAGFDHPANAVTILPADGSAPVEVARADKRIIAEHVLDAALVARGDAPASIR
jgi:phosphopantothenoylcysteine decarboxylase/phosphopantothenate--cysteine ligase